MQATFYDKRTNTVYINTDLILPNTLGMPFNAACKKRKEAFNLTYEERIDKFAPERYKQEILDAIAAHEGCTVSEFSNL